MGGVDSGGIQTSDYPRIVSHINLALTALYSRFPVKSEEVVIRLQDHIQVYYLDRRFAVTNTESTEPIKYLDDSKYMPFNDNVLGIDEVYNEMGETLFLNDEGQYWSIHTPSHNSIQIPYPEKENALIVKYRAGPVKLVAKGLDPETQHVDLPNALLEPLLYFVASRAFSNLNSDQNAEGNNYATKYEASCRKIEELGLIIKDSHINVRLDEAGWI